MFLTTKNKNECCGCKACEQICSQNAIRMVCDPEGFWYPEVDVDKCIGCKKCLQVCSFNADINCIVQEQKVYAAWHKESRVRDRSSSGGFFFEIAKKVIENNGKVIGAVFDDKFIVKHIVVDNLRDLGRLLRSKYVQSDTSGIFKLTKKLINNGDTVLFSGTPCQIEAVYSYLGSKPENLITCEVICFGVPSPQIYRGFLDYLEKKYKTDITDINFKDKSYGWENYRTRILFKNGRLFSEFPKDSYSRMMNARLSTRPSCDVCNMHNGSGLADFTLGDFWGIEKYGLKNIPKNGVSFVKVNSTTGYNMWQCIKDFFEHQLITNFLPSKNNVIANNLRTSFYLDLRNKGYAYVADTYFKSWRYRNIIAKSKFLIKSKISLCFKWILNARK